MSQVAEITGTCHCSWLIFVFLVEVGFCHVGPAGLELLTSGDLPALASQSAWDYPGESPYPVLIIFLSRSVRVFTMSKAHLAGIFLKII